MCYFLTLSELLRSGSLLQSHNRILSRSGMFVLQTSDVWGRSKRLKFAALEDHKSAYRDLLPKFKDFVRAVELVWQQLMANPDCREKGQFMLDHMRKKPIQVLLDRQKTKKTCPCVPCSGGRLICPVVVVCFVTRVRVNCCNITGRVFSARGAAGGGEFVRMLASSLSRLNQCAFETLS